MDDSAGEACRPRFEKHEGEQTYNWKMTSLHIRELMKKKQIMNRHLVRS